MQQTLYTILTSEQARNSDTIDALLDEGFIAGAPWFNFVQSALATESE